MTNTSLEEYLAELRWELRQLDVPGSVIGDAVAQVESHVADSGETPKDAFGTPEEFARELARGRRSVTSWQLYTATAVLTLGGTLLLLKSVFALVQEQPIFWVVPPVWGIVLGGLAVVAWIALLVSRADPVRDPRRQSGQRSHAD